MNLTNALLSIISLAIGTAIGLITLWGRSKKWSEDRAAKQVAVIAAAVTADRARLAADAQAKADAELRVRMVMFMDRLAPPGQKCLGDKFDDLVKQQQAMHKENQESAEKDRLAVTTWQREHEAACTKWHEEVLDMFSSLKPKEIKPLATGR